MNHTMPASIPVRISNRERGRWLRQKMRLMELLGQLECPPDRVQTELINRHLLRPILKLCRRRAGKHAYPAALQFHAKAARVCLDKIANGNPGIARMEFQRLKTHFHACVSMIDAMLETAEPTAIDEFVRIFSGRVPNFT
ncbi:hypothetical protein [Hoeflea poritis]|uniref:Uncharacterized protein n=1 Tax=Hoeflea poritis TaxID=2993659 RepID=A0ABT4VHW5_9HYPH|nr:hypothetical protein [Hoeflea poritis]MDA4844302.1 hypothetical protein [Hoeflea poritis]